MMLEPIKLLTALTMVFIVGSPMVWGQKWDDFDEWDEASDEYPQQDNSESSDNGNDVFWPDEVDIDQKEDKRPSPKKKKVKAVVSSKKKSQKEKKEDAEEKVTERVKKPRNVAAPSRKHKVAFSVKTVAEFGFNRETSGKPSPTISLAPDFWLAPLGFMDLGFVHSTMGKTGIWVGRNDSLCLTLEELDCPRVYDSSSLRFLFKVIRTQRSVVKIDTSVLVQSLSPFSFGIRLGVLWNMTFDKNSLTINPSTTFSIFQRDGTLFQIPLENNENNVFVPIAFIHRFNSKLKAGVQFAVVQNVAVLQLGQFQPELYLNFRSGYNVTKQLSIEALLGLDLECSECLGLNFAISYSG